MRQQKNETTKKCCECHKPTCNERLDMHNEISINATTVLISLYIDVYGDHGNFCQVETTDTI